MVNINPGTRIENPLRTFPHFESRKSARGVRVLDAQGRSYLDLTAAFGVANLGHGKQTNPKAISAQSQKLWHGMGDVHPSRIKIELLELLAKITPGKLQKTILSSSGAEAVESALKTARLYTGKPGVLAFDGAYHGLTYGALAATHRPDFSASFRDQLALFVVHAPYPDSLRGPNDEGCCLRAVQEILRRSRGKIGASLVEPIPARGGIRIPKPFFLKRLRDIATRQNVLLIIDEIYTGYGRTGISVCGGTFGDCSGPFMFGKSAGQRLSDFRLYRYVPRHGRLAKIRR